MNDNIVILLNEMKKQGISSCIIPTSDFHLGEYTPECFKLREWLSGFSGSAGTLVVTEKRSGLWTDGRYYLQAEKELSGSGIELFYAAEKDCIPPERFIIENTEENSISGICGKVFSKKELDRIIGVLKKSNISVNSAFNPFAVWENRPAFPSSKAFLLEEKFSGEEAPSKIARIREKMRKEGFTHYVVCASDAVMWLLNIRGRDIPYTPVILSYLLVGDKYVHLYADEKKFSDNIKAYLKECGVLLCDYDKIYDDIKSLDENAFLAADFSKVNYSLLEGIKCAFKHRNDFIENEKCIRNKTEEANLRKAYIKENTALIKSF